MNKIGIINYQYSNHNYGAVLQAASLHYFLQNKLGLDSEHINFIPNVVKGSKLKTIFRRLLVFSGLRVGNSHVFEDFRKQWLPRTSQTFHSFESMKIVNFDYSHVIVGSDQVWRPSYTDASFLVYFLAFINENIKKISYAASFGNDYWELDDAKTKVIVSELKKFSAISVREKSGVDICQNIFDISAQHVLDPTLLVGRDFFELIIGSEGEKTRDTLVFYKLDIDSNFNDFIKNLSSDLNLEAKNIYYNSIGFYKYYNKVDRWLRDIRNSRFVVTDSFHCVCFAILFEKPFLYYPNDNRGLTRLESLLSQLGLESHIYHHGADPLALAHQLMVVDYPLVNSKLNELRSLSAQFLSNSLL